MSYPRIVFTNGAESALVTGLAASGVATSLTLTSGGGAKFPTLTSPGDYCVISVVNASLQVEIMKVTARTGDVLTVERGWEGSVLQAFGAGDIVALTPTAGTMRDLAASGWCREMNEVAYLGATTFTVAGDRTGIYMPHRALRMTQTMCATGYVVSSSFGGGFTTVITSDVLVDSGLTGVDFGPETGLIFSTPSAPPFAQGIINGDLAVWQRGTSFTGIAGGSTKTVFLTSGSSYTTPADWNNSGNTVMCVGGGGGSGSGNGSYGGYGGGGAAFAQSSNLTLSGTITYSIGAPGTSGNSSAGGNGGDTFFNAASMPASGTSNVVGAKGGIGGGQSGGATGTGGQASASCGSTKYSGGTGGATSYGGGAGGGGAGGPQGLGGNGGVASGVSAGAGGGGSGGGGSGTGGAVGADASSNTGGAGGNNSAGAGSGAPGTGSGAGAGGTVGGGGGGGGGTGAAGDGGSGTDWTATVGGTAGPGGGGGGAGTTTRGGAGGLYGGGGGGGGNWGGLTGNAGAQGIIVLQYTPPVGGTYTADGFFASAQGGNATVSRQAGTNGYPYKLRLQRPNGNTATEEHKVGHIIEGLDCLRFRDEAVTLSFTAKKGANYSGGDISVKLYTGTTADEGFLAMLGGTWTGSVLEVNTTQALTTSDVQYSFAATLDANINEIGFIIGYTPTGTAGADDWIEIEGVALKLGTAVAEPTDFPQYAGVLHQCQRRCVVASTYVPATTAQNLRTLHMRATPSITGGGSGFTSTGTSKDTLIGYQSSGGVATLTLAADL